MIKLVNVSKFYNSKGVINMALKDINLTLNKGEIVAIVGESGSGKSTLLNIICGIDNYDEGEIYFNDQETSYFNQEDMDNFRQKNVSFIYQNYNVIDSYTVLENVMVPLLLKGMKEKEAKERAKELIKKVGLEDSIKSKAINLSGGEKQRTVIARALATDCPILACDEITGNLDSKTGDEIIELIKEVAKDKLVLMVTHNLEQCEHIITRKIRLSDGTIVEDTCNAQDDAMSTDELLDNERKASAGALATITKWNIKNTPKKTIFSTIVMYAIAFVVVFLISLGTYLDTFMTFGDYASYALPFDDRVVVYNKDASKLNKSDFSSYDQKNVVYNSMVEDAVFQLDAKSGAAFNPTGSITPHLDKEMTIVKGREVSAPGEMVLCSYSKNDSLFEGLKLGDNYTLYYSPSFQAFGDAPHDYLKIVGFAFSPKIPQYTYVLENTDFNLLSESVRTAELCSVDFAQNRYVDVNADLMTYQVSKNVNDEISKPRVMYTGSDHIKVDSIEVEYFKPHKIVITDFDLVCVAPNPLEVPQVVGVEMPTDYLPDDIFEVAIYTNEPRKVVKDMESKGYEATIAGKAVSKSTINATMSKYFVIISLVSGFILNLVAYVIVSRIYAYKIKEFAVFRSLGYLRSSMSKIVHNEMSLIGLISLVIGIGTSPIIGIWVPFFKEITTCYTVLGILGSIAIVLLLSNFLAWRLNRKIFKESLVKTFKNEEAK